MTDLLDLLARFSSTDPDREGVTRLPFTPEQENAARWLSTRMEELGMDTRVDAYGTVSGFFPGQSEEVLILGSHYDSVPRGGRYDGCAGVAAALEVVSRLRRQARVPYYSLMVLALNDEEGVRLSEGFLSSHSVCGDLSPADLERIYDRTTGQPLAQLLAASPFDRAPILLPEKARAYLEFHVEQGPVLEQQNIPTAIVDHIVGVYHCFYQLRGVQNHAGTTPMASRSDPLPAFGRIAALLPELALQHPGSVATIGFVDVCPNVPNVISDHIRFSVDLRSADPEVLDQLRAQTDRLVHSQADQAGLALSQTASTDAAPVIMDPVLAARLEQCTLQLGLPVFHMDSGAGHDAQIFARKLPTAMLFARSRMGLSHCREEFTQEADLEHACEILYEFVKEPF